MKLGDTLRSLATWTDKTQPKVEKKVKDTSKAVAVSSLKVTSVLLNKVNDLLVKIQPTDQS